MAKYETNINDGESSVKVPDAVGYINEEDCANCGNSHTEEGNKYQHPETGEVLVDIYCTFCGAILETKVVGGEDSNEESEK